MPEWYQQHLTAPEVVEVVIRLGIIPSTDHVQAQVELSDPMTKVVIAQWSHPHSPLSQWQAVLERATTKAEEYTALHVEPF